MDNKDYIVKCKDLVIECYSNFVFADETYTLKEEDIIVLSFNIVNNNSSCFLKTVYDDSLLFNVVCDADNKFELNVYNFVWSDTYQNS